jgi:SagB-type dehydrogenase family enzyme
MNHRTLVSAALLLAVSTAVVLSGFAQDMKPVLLPEPKLDPNKSLAQALKDRKTTREYAVDSLSPQTLSNMLWAACGINRPDSGRRTAPTALNWQEIDVYVSTAEGTFLYDPKANALVPVATGDIRNLTYTQDRFKEAPVHLVYVSDLERTGSREEERVIPVTAMDTGFVAQNVYLYCASEGLPTGFRVSIDKEKLAQALKLRPTQRIMAAQSVGLPKGK